MGNLLTSWKTSLAGFLILVCVALYFANIIDQGQLLTGISVLGGAGLLAGKDGNVSGTQK